MKPTKKDNRFNKIVKAIVEKSSPTDKSNAMGVEDEADAVDQEGKKAKKKPRDMDPDWNK